MIDDVGFCGLAVLKIFRNDSDLSYFHVLSDDKMKFLLSLYNFFKTINLRV